MKNAKKTICAVAAVVLMIQASATQADVFNLGGGQTNLEIVPIGNPGNVADTHGAGYGAVDYNYNIGKYEVTAGQYTAFLNAVAKMDTYGLYNADMWSSSYGCKIQRSNQSGSYAYSVASDYANRPVNYVSFWDACRFANWLNNGQDGGDTETGTYTLTAGAVTSNTVIRNADWKWAVTSEDEWYKAAFHKNNGVTGNYFDYSTSSDTIPGRDMTEATNPGNNTNYYGSPWPIDSAMYYNTVAGEFQMSDSPYGTFDQGGNVWEWNESVISSSRGLRGGSFLDYDSYLRAAYRGYYGLGPASEDGDVGFRVSAIPEPASLLLLSLGGILAIRKKQFKSK
jgi:sulfatase modifying factor 1